MASDAKKTSIEKIYQKKSQLEHILLRPDTYIGSVEVVEQEMWIWDFDNEKMIKKNIKFVPGLFKIFDEILVNAADNKIRDPDMSTIKVKISKEENVIEVYNDGKGIPIQEHKEEKVYVPTLIFGHLLTSSNYDDNEKKVTGGRNGYGAKLCNIFSKKFIVETAAKDKYFKQTWTDNMSKTAEPTIKTKAKGDEYTKVTFYPDLSKFGMTTLDDDIVCLLAKRTYDIAASTRGVKVYLNNKKLPISKFEDYCKFYVCNNTSGGTDDILNNSTSSSGSKILYCNPNPRWEVAVSFSDIGFQQVSFVNSISTSKGGRHVDYICDQLIKYLTEVINKKNGKNSTQIKPFQIKNHLWLFVNCLIENPVFESQTKECMSLQVKNFGSKCILPEDFLKKVSTKAGIVDRVLNWLAFKEKTDLEKTGAKSKQSKIKGIPKLDDANNAGTRDSINCTLILTEGDSAKTLAVAGLGVIGRDRYGVFPLRGKMLNVREATPKQILENAEISSICKIVGLNFREKYEEKDSLKHLRYGKIMIMTDQDHDGSHIKGLIINFIHFQWPNLLKHGFIEEFITPIIKVFKNKKANQQSGEEKAFYSMPEFEEWQKSTPDWHTWKIKYYKGLGTSTSKEAKEYFSNMARHCIKFEYSGTRDDLAIQLAFSKKFVDERKDWLTKYMEKRNLQNQSQSANNDYLYQKNTKKINFTEFVNKELVLFSNLDNERSIPSLVDGFKPGQRKVIFVCFKRNLVKEIKVAQLAGSVSELSAYHHGEQSLMSTIINLAQNFVGSNNLNLLLPIGQFGTRLHGGKDAASPRYIFTSLNPLTRLLFNPKDDSILNYLNDDGQRVEPEFYCPILPTVLVNGAEGIGTGWAVKVPNYNVRDLISNLRLILNKQEPKHMKPFYKNFRGTIDGLDDTHYMISGEVALIDDDDSKGKSDYTIEISELPIGTWTQVYKESVLESYLHGTESKDGKQHQLINDYKEYHTDCTVRFLVKMSKSQYQHAAEQSLHKFFKIQKSMSLNSMVLFDANGCLKRYNSALEILKDFYAVRYNYYIKRKQYLEDMLTAESLKLDNIARFILEKIEGKIKVENLKKKDLVKMLATKGYDSDPIKKWKDKITKEKGYIFEGGSATSNDADAQDSDDTDDQNDFNYLLSMPIWNLTLEKKEDIIKQQKAKGNELKLLKAKTVEQLWLDDLNEFEKEYEKMELKEKEELDVNIKKSIKASGNNKKGIKFEYMPAPDGERVQPVLDPQLIAKVEKDSQLKTLNKAKKDEASNNLNIVDVITSEEKLNEEKIKQIDELAQNLLNPKKPVKVKPPVTPKSKASKSDENSGDTNGNLDSTINEGDSDKKPKISKSKVREKITVDSDSEASFNSDFETKANESVVKRELGRARKAVKYDMDDDDDDEDEDEKEIISIVKEEEPVVIDEINLEVDKKEEDEKEEKKPQPKKRQTKPAAPKASAPKKTPPKRKSPASKTIDSDDESIASEIDDEDSDFEVKKPKRAKAKPTTPARKVTKKSAEFVVDSDASDEKLKAAAPARKKPRKAKIDEDDEDDILSLD